MWPVNMATMTAGPLLTQAVTVNIFNVYCGSLTASVAADDQSYFLLNAHTYTCTQQHRPFWP